MPLFNNKPPLDGNIPAGMSSAEYINRSTRRPIMACKGLLEDWFERYPENDKTRLKGDLTGRREEGHQSAFFELFLHELLIRKGFIVEAQPALDNHARVPDFRCRRGELTFFIEARDCNSTSTEDRAAINRLQQAYDVINRRVTNPLYFIGVTSRGLPSMNISAVDLSNQISAWLDSLNHANEIEKHPDAPATTMEFESPGLQLTFTAHAVPIRNGDRIIGIDTPGHATGWSRTSATIMAAVNEKASAYGELDHPFIVAVNANDSMMSNEDAISALLGNRHFFERIKEDGTVEQFITHDGAGAFGNEVSPRNINPTGVLVFNNIEPLGLRGRRALYVPHPYSTTQIICPFPNILNITYPEGRIQVNEPAETLLETLDLQPEWPITGDGDEWE